MSTHKRTSPMSGIVISPITVLVKPPNAKADYRTTIPAARREPAFV